jgi:glycine cleavage system H protein
MWALPREATRWRFGFTAYAVHLLQDVYFLEWTVEASTRLAVGDAVGTVESKKAERELCAPMSGRLTTFNQLLLDDPSIVNVDGYGDGWLFEMQGKGEELVSAGDYLRRLETVWEETRRTVRGPWSRS